MHFVNTNDNRPEATRLHLEPTINLPLSNNWGSINTELKLMATHYQQNNISEYQSFARNNYRNNPTPDNLNTLNAANSLEESVNRVMPQFKVDGKLVLNAIWKCWRRAIPRRWSRARSTCTCRIAIKVIFSTMTRPCCKLTTAACSVTVPMAVWTVSLPPTGHDRGHISRL